MGETAAAAYPRDETTLRKRRRTCDRVFVGETAAAAYPRDFSSVHEGSPKCIVESARLDPPVQTTKYIDGPGAAANRSVIFIECFAGQGTLTKAMRRVGFEVEEPQDLDRGGIDFSNDAEVTHLWKHWTKLSEGGFQLLFHFAPPALPSPLSETAAGERG